MANTVRVGPIYNTILECPEILGENYAGQVNHNLSVIKLCPMIDRQCRMNTLLHEIVHAIIHVSGTRDEELTKERVADLMAFGFMSLVRDNPGLIREIQELYGRWSLAPIQSEAVEEGREREPGGVQQDRVRGYHLRPLQEQGSSEGGVDPDDG